MSWWTYVRGYIKIDLYQARTQAEADYLIQTILNHMPRITGSEGDASINILKESGNSCASSDDEYGNKTNNLVDWYGNKSQKGGWLETQTRYYVFIEGNLRDRMFNETCKETMKFLCRFSKRVVVDDILIKIKGYNEELIINDYKPFSEMYEEPSWCNNTGEPAWWEHLLWKPYERTGLPLSLLVKYYYDEYADKEWNQILMKKHANCMEDALKDFVNSGNCKLCGSQRCDGSLDMASHCKKFIDYVKSEKDN